MSAFLFNKDNKIGNKWQGYLFNKDNKLKDNGLERVVLTNKYE